MVTPTAIQKQLPTWRDEYPFSSNYLQIEGGRLHYVDEGKTEAVDKPTLLMVHGNPTWSFYWRRLIRRFGSDYRVVAIDHLGCGLSDKPTGYDYCLANHIENLCQLIDHLDLNNVTLLAHDWGGAIGMGALQARQDRFNRIVLFNTAAFPPPFIPFRIRVCRWPIFGRVGVQGFNMFARAATFMATEQIGGLSPTIADGFLHPYNSWNNRVAVYNFVKDIPLSPRHRTWNILQRMEDGLADLSSWPIMLMWGMKDWCFRPECLARFQKHWPDAIVHEFSDAGHYVIEDAADEVEKCLKEFLFR